MHIIPAIDLRAGGVVRLRQGDYSAQTDYPIDPIELAEQYAVDGAVWLHLVDLDGARSGVFENLGVIEAIAQTGKLKLQAGGGVRSDADVQRLLDAGVARVVVGSIAVRDAERVKQWLARYGAERICIALDTRFANGAWGLPSAGWTQVEGATLDELAPIYAAAGMRHLLCTDIHRDGMLSGPNLALYRHLAQLVPGVNIIASGGVRDANDVQALRAEQLSGVVLGRSLLERKVTLAQALAC